MVHQNRRARSSSPQLHLVRFAAVRVTPTLLLQSWHNAELAQSGRVIALQSSDLCAGALGAVRSELPAPSQASLEQLIGLLERASSELRGNENAEEEQ